jgi:hypothetical protein
MWYVGFYIIVVMYVDSVYGFYGFSVRILRICQSLTPLALICARSCRQHAGSFAGEGANLVFPLAKCWFW